MNLIRGLWSRLTYANIMSSIALFVALSGGAYALSVPKNSVGASELRPGAVTAAKVKHHSLTASVFKRGALPVLGGVRAADLNPPPRPTTVIKSVKLNLRAEGKVFVLGTVRDVFLTCSASPCSGQWGVYVDNRPVPSTGMRLQAAGYASDGHVFYTLYGLTKRLPSGRHTVTLGQTSTGSPQSIGQLGVQLGALTLGG